MKLYSRIKIKLRCLYSVAAWDDYLLLWALFKYLKNSVVQNLYNSQCVHKIKTDFHSMMTDQWTRKGCSDPSVDHDLSSKLYPWRNVLVRDPVPASERLAKIQLERRKEMPYVETIPKLYVYHRY